MIYVIHLPKNKVLSGACPTAQHSSQKDSQKKMVIEINMLNAIITRGVIKYLFTLSTRK